jgi:leucyl-tRNA synthetase
MKFVNLVDATGAITEDQFKRFLVVLYPFAPFISEELYSQLEFVRDATVYYRKKDFLQQEIWPTFDPEKIKSQTSVIAIQINGKLRHTVEVDTNITKEDLITHIENEEPVTRWLNGKTVSESIKAYIPGKIVSLVVK